MEEPDLEGDGVDLEFVLAKVGPRPARRNPLPHDSPDALVLQHQLLHQRVLPRPRPALGGPRPGGAAWRRSQRRSGLARAP